ncbi:C-terminal-binding protein [Pseudohyphozyma bogoriensis]|nr:C-terminal-binding protein [Pseudohyphozyma bogoriensis]
MVAKTAGKTKVLVLELEGMAPDGIEEAAIFSAPPEHNFEVEFLRAGLGGGDGPLTPLSTLSDELCARVDGLLVFRHYLTREDIARFTNLKVVVRMGVGYDRLDRVALAEKGVTVCNVPDYGTAEIADHALALALTLRRGVLLHHEHQRHQPPAPWVVIHNPLVARIQGATFGVLGLGRIGTAAALRAKAFGWNVIFYDPYLSNGVDKSLALERVRTLDELFARSTTLSIHCPNTRETKGMINSRLINLMPPGAIIVNTARGECVDLDAVEEGLKSGRLAGAGLDVLAVEPIPEPAHPLIQAYRNKEEWLEGRLVITPHAAFYSPSSLDDIRTNSAQTIRNVLLDGGKSNVILPTQE